MMIFFFSSSVFFFSSSSVFFLLPKKTYGHGFLVQQELNRYLNTKGCKSQATSHILLLKDFSELDDYHGDHLHTLRLEFVREAYVCNSCKEVGFGKRYSCPEKGCDFHIHDVCVDPPKTRHHLVKKRAFSFVSGVDGRNCYCDACGWDINGSFYHSMCRPCRGHGLHPCRALNLESKISNDHVDLFLREKLSHDCHLCGLKKVSNGRKSWGYVFEDNKKYQFHLYCVKKKLIENWEMITLSVGDPIGKGDYQSTALVLIRSINYYPDDRSQSQIEARDNYHHHLNKKRMKTTGKISMVKNVLHIIFDLIVAVFLGNPTGLIIDLGSFLLST